MKISRLVQILEGVKDQEGDLDVKVETSEIFDIKGVSIGPDSCDEFGCTEAYISWVKPK